MASARQLHQLPLGSGLLLAQGSGDSGLPLLLHLQGSELPLPREGQGLEGLGLSLPPSLPGVGLEGLVRCPLREGQGLGLQHQHLLGLELSPPLGVGSEGLGLSPPQERQGLGRHLLQGLELRLLGLERLLLVWGRVWAASREHSRGLEALQQPLHRPRVDSDHLGTLEEQGRYREQQEGWG